MGLSSSQARLLSLTSRQHDIEYKAQRLEAQKLQMANESAHVYSDYQNALNQSKIQVSTLSANGNAEFKDASLALIENMTDTKLAQPTYLRNTTNNKVYISNAQINKYNLDGTGNVPDEMSFMKNAGYNVTINNYAVLNNTTSNYYIPVSNTVVSNSTRVVPNINPDLGYQDVTSVDTAALQTVSSVSSFVEGQTYSINSKDDLIKLSTLANSGISTKGVTFELGGNIDMTGVNWTGIGNTTANAFKGIFDGNGYTISNLKGSSGLFTYATGDQTSVTNPTTGVTTTSTYGIIKNINLDNINITKTTGETGGLVCMGTGITVSNCNVTGTIKAANWVGGLIGHNEHGAVSNSTANVNITGSGTCVGGFIGHDTNGIVSNCVSQGTVKSTAGYVGGFIGHETAGGKTFIYNCSTTAVVSGADPKGAFIGVIDGGCAATVINTQYSASSTVGTVGLGGSSMTSSGNGNSLTDGATRTVTTTNISMPSADVMKSNILMAVDKSGISVGSDFETKLTTWINQFYKVSPTTSGALDDSALKLASLNNYIDEYLTANGNDTTLATNLISDITNNTLVNTSEQQKDYVPTKEYEYTAIASSDTTLAQKKSPIDTVSSDNISNNLYSALRKAGYTDLSTIDDVTNLQNWLKSNIPANTDSNKLLLANINALSTGYENGTITDKSELTAIYNAYKNDSSYSMSDSAKAYVGSNYYVSDMSNESQSYSADWDMTNSNIVDALNFYQVVKNGYMVVDDANYTSTTWLSNMVNSGFATLSQYNTNTKNIFDTNVATNTSFQEVSDDTQLKKAEAKYEADMRKIDAKDKKYDTDLAALEAERNAIKTEIDTLKTVAKDNVERTFKLFS